MKLKFTIPYATQWGEALHVVLCYQSKDGTKRRQNQLMQTQDGQLWTLETAVVESRQHPVCAVLNILGVCGFRNAVRVNENLLLRK